jgi:C4-dicarboxylate transporter, DctM subunit
MLETVFIGIGLILLALLGTPLFIIIAAISLLSFHAAGIDTSSVIIELYRLASAPTLIAIPLFTFAGYLLAESNAPQRLVAVARALFGWMPGGMAMVALFSCAFFTAFTGASGVTIVALGGLLMPIMLNEKYRKNFSLGLMTSSGSLGLLFPRVSP